MWKNYLLVAIRNMRKSKAFSIINISGLAFGITCSLLIMLWVKDEQGMDGFHKNNKQLYQVYERWTFDGKTEASYPTQGLLAQELKKVIPEVQFASGFEYASAPGTLNNFEGGEKVNKMGGMYVDGDFLSMFSYPLLEGKATTALNSPNSIAVSRNMAEYFFGTAGNAIGKIIRFENKEDLQISAVFENVPSNSSQQFDFLRSWIDFVKQNTWVNNWGNSSPATFVQLHKEADVAKVQKEIKDFIYRYQQKSAGSSIELALQPYSEKYLHSSFKNGNIEGGRIEYVRIFTLVAIFIMLIACINFMNMATARSVNRAKEVGLRKVVGAARSSLISQFIGEALVLSVFSVAVALLLTYLVLPVFNDVTGKQLSLPFTQPLFWITLTGIIIATGFVAGSYPALFLSSLNPVKVLKGSLKFGREAILFRKGLVVFQFTLAIILITGVIVIYRQVNYIQSKNLGYDRDHLVYIPIEGELIKNYAQFKERAGAIPAIENISKMRNTPTIIEHHTGSIEWSGKDKDLQVSFADGVVGYDFVKTMKLQLKEGRDFSTEFGTDSASYILNETAVKKIGFKDPVGQTVIWGNRRGKVIGVLKDFHFASMHQAIDPLIVRLDENWGWGTILVRIKPGKTKEAIAGLEKICREVNPKFPFTYQFSDLAFSRLYKSEEMVSRLSYFFAFLAIFISCLGLFGLSTFTASQRIKEIGVRKVLGASVKGIIGLLSVNFLKPIAIAVLIAIPVSSYLTNQWLERFAYKVDIEWWIFLVAGTITVFVAVLTVSYQSIKAAMSNPVKSLRSE
jgi:ABC-type antimicrobial peptide transport system permease subunit